LKKPDAVERHGVEARKQALKYEFYSVEKNCSGSRRGFRKKEPAGY